MQNAWFFGSIPVAFWDLVRLVMERASHRPDVLGKVAFADWRPSDQKVYISDVSKAEKTLGWKAVTSPEKGVNNLVEWVQENKKIF